MDLGLYNDLLGKSYKSYSRGPDSYDCYTLVQELYNRLDQEFPDVEYLLSAKQIISSLESHRDEVIKLDVPVVGCIVAFHVNSPYVSHIGMMVSSYQFIHALAGAGVRLNRIDILPWNQKVEGFYQWPN